MKIFTPRVKDVERMCRHGYEVNVAEEIDLLNQLHDYLDKAGDPRTALLALVQMMKRSKLNENHD